MTNPTLNPNVVTQLTNQLNSGGVNQNAYDTLIADINSSPELINQLNNDASLVSQFSWSAQVGSGASYNPGGGGTLSINISQLLSADSSTEVFAIGHELGHAEFDANNAGQNPTNITESQADLNFQNAISAAITSGGNFTSAINAIQANFNSNESYAQIQGFNDALSGYYAQNPTGSVSEAYAYLSQNANFYAGFFLQNGALLPGLTAQANGDGSLPETLANMGAEGNYYYLDSPSTLSIFQDKNYANSYGTSELDGIVNSYLLNSGNYSVNGSQIAITPTIQINFQDISTSNDGTGNSSFNQSFDPNLLAQDLGSSLHLPSGATSVSFTVQDTSTGTSYVYTVNNGVSSVATTAPGSTPLVYIGESSNTNPAGTMYQATASNAVVTVAAYYGGEIDGSNDTDILGNGSTIVTLAGGADNTITCGNSSATINGVSADSCSISQAGNSQLTVDGSGLTGSLQGNVVLTESGDTFDAGSNAVITMASGDTINVATGTSGVQLGCGSATETVSGGTSGSDSVQCTIADGTGAFTNNGNDLTIADAGGNLSVFGNSNLVDTGTGAQVDVDGSNDLVNAGSGSKTTLTGTGETVDLIDNSDSSVNFGDWASGTVNGADETVGLGYRASATLNLNANASNASDGSDETLNTWDNVITVNGNGADLTITGGDSTVTAGDGITALINGGSTIFDGGSDNTVTFDASGGTANLTADGDSLVSFAGGLSGAVTGAGNDVDVLGSGDSISATGETFNFSGGGDSTTISGSNNLVNTDADSQTTLNGTGETVDLIDNSDSSVNFGDWASGTVNGADETVGFGYRASATLNLNANTSNASEGSDETLNTWDNAITVNGNGADLTITGESAVVTADNDITALISGSSITYDGGSDNTVTFNGSGGTANLTSDGDSLVSFAGGLSGAVTGAGNDVDVLGSGDSISATGETFNFSGSGDSTTISGSNNLVNADADSQTTLNGTGETVDLVDNSGSSVNVGYGSSSTVNGAGETVDVGEYSSVSVNLDANDSDGAAGSTDTINFSYGDSATVTGNGENLMVAGEVVSLTAGNDVSATLNGYDLNYTGGTDDTVTFINGNGTGSASLTADGGSTVNFDNGASGSVSGVGNLVNVLDTGSDINASGEMFNISENDATTIDGSNNLVDAATGAQIDTSGSGNTFDLVDNSGSSVNVGGYSSATINGAGNVVDVGYGSSVDINLDASGSDAAAGSIDAIDFYYYGSANVNGDGETLNVSGASDSLTAGNDVNVTLNGGGMNYTGGTDNIVTYAGGSGKATLAADGDSTVNFDNGASGSVIGEGNEVNVLGSGSDINASGEMFNISDNDASTTIDGSNNLVDAAAGAQIDTSGSSNTFDLVDNSGSSVSVGGYSSATINGAGNTVDVGYGSSADINLDASGSDAAAGSINAIDFYYYGSADVTGDGETLNVSGVSDSLTAGSDVSVTLNGTDLKYTGGTDNAVIFAGNGETANLTADGDSTVTFAANNLSGTVTGAGNNIDVLGTDTTTDINAVGETFNFSGGGDITTIDGSSNLVNAGSGSQTTLDGTGETVDLANNSGSSVSFGNWSGGTVNGVGETVGLGYGASVTLGASDTGVTVDGSDASISASDDSAMTVDGTDDVITASNTRVDISGDDALTIDGSNDVIVGGSGDDFTVNGASDVITATDSTVTYDGSNANDGIFGTGDSWSDPSEDTSGDGGVVTGGGYYGYGLTRWKGTSPTAKQIAAAEQSDSVYEGASWSDKTITWSLASASGSFSGAITNAQEQASVDQAFQTWAKASGLQFQEVAPGAQADIEVGFSDLNPASTNAIGLTNYDSQNGTLDAGVKVELEDPSQAALTTNAAGQLVYASTDATFEQVALHEIGHALGLADNDIAGSIMNAVLGANNQMLGGTDVANVQALYGVPSTPSNSATQSVTQVHQLVQAMSQFDAAEMGIDHSDSESSMAMYQERSLAAMHESRHAA